MSVVRPSSSRNTIVCYFYYLILPKLLHVSVVRPSSGKNTIVGYFYYLIPPKLLHVSVVRPGDTVPADLREG
jgi:hypothetical protein